MPDDKIFDRIEKQMFEFQKRLEKLEERQRDIYQQSPDKLKKEKSQKQEGIERDKI